MPRPQKPPGTLCTLSPFTTPEHLPPVHVGEYLRTRAGSCYEVLEAHAIKGSARRQRLQCVRVNPTSVPEGATVLGMVWDSRKKRRPST